MPEQEVHFILDPDYRGDLWSLSRRAHVWICSSPANDAQYQRVCDQETEEYSELQGVSSFELGSDVVATFYGFLGTIDEHHDGDATTPPWSRIHVVGLSSKVVSMDRILAELAPAAVAIDPDAGGFTLRRIERPDR